MTWNYAYTPMIWPSLFTVLLLIALSIYTGRRRSVPGALPFTVALLFAALWSTGSLMEYLAVDLAAKVNWIKFQAIWQIPVATAVTCFALEYVWPGRWVNRRVVALLSIPPVIVALLIFTDPLHHLMWKGFAFDKTVTPLLGPVSWVSIVYGYGFVAIDLVIFAWLFMRSPQHRGFVAIMFTGQAVIRTVYLLERMQLVQSDLPLDVFGIAFAYLMYTTALFRYRVLNPILLARQTVIGQMHEGMLVLDTEEKVATMNPAAEQILGLHARTSVGMPVRDLLPAYPGEPLDGEQVEIEFSLGGEHEYSTHDSPGQEVRHYTLAISSLKDWRGLDVGRLLLLHDVTGQRLAQAHLVEHQRALATMKERDQVARELHDQLAQELALINVQAQVVCGLLEAGQTEQARGQLQLLAKLARETHLDVRGQIRALSTTTVREGDLRGTLGHLLDIFHQTYGVETELAFPEEQAAIYFPPMVEVQLRRIIQEALTNIGKHACAKLVRVALMREDGRVEIKIEDDGVGFDPHNRLAPGHSFGLDIMSARAGEINARMEVISAPGKGTCIALAVPVRTLAAVPVTGEPEILIDWPSMV